jgi:hypothetical protein
MRDRAESRAPRVLYCTDTYPPQVNGVSVVTALSVAGLRARLGMSGGRAEVSGSAAAGSAPSARP